MSEISLVDAIRDADERANRLHCLHFVEQVIESGPYEDCLWVALLHTGRKSGQVEIPVHLAKKIGQAAIAVLEDFAASERQELLRGAE